MSIYQQMKPYILDFLHLSRDAVHIHVGFACFALMILFSQKKLSSWMIIIPGLILSILMELMDMRDDYNLHRRIRLLASAHDLVNTNAIPFALVILAKLKRVKI